MSKKMMKRSLALGALMAFVITGSAMAMEASEFSASEKYNSNADGVRLKDITTQNAYVLSPSTNGIRIGVVWESDIGNNNLSVTFDKLKVESTCNGIYLQKDAGENTITAKEIEISGLTRSGAIQSNADNTVLNVEGFDKFNITVTSKNDDMPNGKANGVRAANNNGIVNIVGNDNSTFTINAANNGLYASNAGAQINIKNVGELTITSLGVDEGETVAQGNAIAVSGGKVDIKADTVTLNSAGQASGEAYDKFESNAILVNNGTATIKANTLNVNGTVLAIGSEAYFNSKGVLSYKNSGSQDNIGINLYGENIIVDAKGGQAIKAKGDTVGGDNTVIVVGDASSKTTAVEIKNASYGLFAQYRGSVIDVNGAKLDINKTEVGVYAGNCKDTANTVESTSYAEVNLNSAYTKISDADIGLYALSRGNINVYGELELVADTAIKTRGGAKVNINNAKSDDTDIKITGDIVFVNTTKLDNPDNEWTGVNADVNINLTTDESWLKGNIYAADGDGNRADSIAKHIKGMNIYLANGATWELSEASVVNQASFGKDTVLALKEGSIFEKQAEASKDVYALNAGGGTENKLTVANGAKLQIGGMKETTYNLATGFGDYADVKGWNVIADNALMSVTLDKSNGNLKATLKADADAMEDSGAAPVGSGDMLQDLIKNGADNEDSKAAYEFVKKVTSNGGDVLASNNALSNALQMAEAGGNSGTAVTIANNVSSATTGRMGFSGGEKGGHGVGLLAEDSGAAIWAQYVHGKDRVEDMPMSGGATSYEGQFNGVVMGVDFKKVGKFQSGVAFNYGEGDTNSFGNAISTRSDYDFWGVGYYGNIRNEDTNFIFDINYAKSDSDVEQVNGGTTLEASPETTTWSAGVKVEKLYQNNNVQIVPYTGLRFMSVDTDSYKATNGTDTLFNYAPERQDIWLLPLGVSIKQEVTNANGWVVTPKVDLSYIWAFGDTDSEMTVAIPGVSSTSRLGYTVMDDESWLGVVGLEAAKGDWTFGVSYSYQKGDHSENEKWYVDAKYSF